MVSIATIRTLLIEPFGIETAIVVEDLLQGLVF